MQIASTALLAIVSTAVAAAAASITKQPLDSLQLSRKMHFSLRYTNDDTVWESLCLLSLKLPCTAINRCKEEDIYNIHSVPQ